MRCNKWIPDEIKLWTDEAGQEIAIVEGSIRTCQGRMTLTPTKRNNELIVGVFGRAQDLYGFDIYSLSMMTNHTHYQLGIRDPVQLGRIKDHLHSNITREVQGHGDFGPEARGIKLEGRMWDGPGLTVPILDDASLEARFKYVLSNGTKEGLVRHPIQMPTAHAAKPLCRGHRTLRGVWYDRTELWRLRQARREYVPESEVATIYELKFAKLPHLRHLSDEAYASYCRDVCDEIASEARKSLAETHGPNFRPMGPRKMRRVHPLTLADAPPKRRKPLVHCVDRARKRAFRKAYREFVTVYQAAHRRLKAAILLGQRIHITFPPGGIPPASLLAN